MEKRGAPTPRLLPPPTVAAGGWLRMKGEMWLSGKVKTLRNSPGLADQCECIGVIGDETVTREFWPLSQTNTSTSQRGVRTVRTLVGTAFWTTVVFTAPSHPPPFTSVVSFLLRVSDRRSWQKHEKYFYFKAQNDQKNPFISLCCEVTNIVCTISCMLLSPTFLPIYFSINLHSLWDMWIHYVYPNKCVKEKNYCH